MLREIEYRYYEWLISQILTPNNGKTYNELFDRMHQTEFVWLVPNDDNRVGDALDLRREFVSEIEVYGSLLPFEGVSVLEVLIALSRRTAFIAEGDPRPWAWKLIKHLRLNRMSDPLTDQNMSRIDGVLQNLIWRTYRENGQGGFFPLRDPREDQTKVEIWFQMNAYVNEMFS